MPFNLTPYDQKLAESVVVSTIGLNPISGFPPGGNKFKFQFPPIIKTESKKSQWDMTDKTMTWEPVYVYRGALPRTISLTAVYIVGGPATSGREWTSKEVGEEMRRWKAYFYNDGTKESKLPTFAIQMYEQAPGKGGLFPTFWRSTGISIKYSDTIVEFAGGSGGQAAGDPVSPSAHPLMTTVTLSLELATNIRMKDGRPVFKFVEIEDKPPQEWY